MNRSTTTARRRSVRMGRERATEPAWVRGLKAAARERFNAMAWPTPAEEEWRRTDLTRIDFSPYLDGSGLADGVGPGPLIPAEPFIPAEAYSPDGDAAGVAILGDGGPDRMMLCAEAREQGAKLLPLAQALEEFEDVLAPMLTKDLAEADNRFIAWHMAEMERGVFLFIPEGAQIRQPFIIERALGGARPLWSPHAVVYLESGASATVARAATGGGPRLCNDGLDIVVSDDASLSFWDLQAFDSEPLSFFHARASVGRNASLRHFSAFLGGRLVKARVDCSLEGSGADAGLTGMYFSGASQHMDIRTVQRHTSKSAVSRAFYKGAVKDNGVSIFQGLIEVGPGASGTDAFLTNKNLILSDGARSDSIPSLKIGNNDVKCSHGSTTSRIDAEHLFYLESRGLAPEEARRMIVTGYFEELLSDAPPAFMQRVLAVTQGLLAALK